MKAAPKVIELEKGNENLMYRIKATNLPKDTMLVVPETHSAILIKDGRLMDTLNGGKYPLFDAKSEKKSESISVEIIYLSKTVKLKANWGTKVQFQYRDSELDLPVRVGARGEFEVQISNPRKAYLELIGMDSEFVLDKLRERLATRMLSKVEPAISKVMIENNLPFERIGLYKEEISEAVFKRLVPMFEDEYGLKIFSFTFEDIFANEEDAQALEEERQRRKAKREQKDEANEEKREKMEQDSIDWDRTKYLLALKQSDYEKYLEVCKVIGWKPEPRTSTPHASGRFCSNCGTPYGAGDKFCPECGAPVGNTKKVCPKCGKEYPSTAKFCSECGQKL